LPVITPGLAERGRDRGLDPCPQPAGEVPGAARLDTGQQALLLAAIVEYQNTMTQSQNRPQVLHAPIEAREGRALRETANVGMWVGWRPALVLQEPTPKAGTGRRPPTIGSSAIAGGSR